MTREVLKKGLETFGEREKSYLRSTAGGAIYVPRMELVPGLYDFLAELYGVCKEINDLYTWIIPYMHLLLSAVHVETIYIYVYVCDWK